MTFAGQEQLLNYLEKQTSKSSGGTRRLVVRGKELERSIGTRIKNSDMVVIVNFLNAHPDVIALELPYNEISDCGIATLVKHLQESPNLKYLNLIGNEIGLRGIHSIVEMGENFPLHSLRLTGNKFGTEGGIALSKLLFTKNELRFLDLSDTHQNNISLSYIMTGLMHSRGGSKTLEYINISRPLPQPYHQIDDGLLAQFLSQIFHDNDTLKELHVQQYQLDFSDMEIMMEGLYTNKTLICLDLNNNNLGDDGVAYLSDYLSTSPPLECLMIGANNISTNGALSLSVNLPYSKLKLLDLTNNRITDEGMSNIFYALERTENLKALFIWGNRLTPTSLVILQRLIHRGVLDPDHVDVKLHHKDNQIFAFWDPKANKYTQRYYCISECEHDVSKKPLKRRREDEVKVPFAVRQYIEESGWGQIQQMRDVNEEPN